MTVALTTTSYGYKRLAECPFCGADIPPGKGGDAVSHLEDCQAFFDAWGE